MSNLKSIGLDLQRELNSGVRSAIRYPVNLPVKIICRGQEYTGETENFSSSGALFRFPVALPVGSAVEFLIQIPSGLLGSDQTAAIHGDGQLIRSYRQDGRNFAAMVIHEYRFQ